MRNAFSLLELIFAIVLIGIISAFAIPKYLNSKDNALATTIKRDVITTVSSIQSYYLLNQDIEKIEDAVIINASNWEKENLKISFKSCVELEVIKNDESSFIDLRVSNSNTKVCEILKDMGIYSQKFDLM